jgi:predicted phage terminase large subunit-like protein
MGAIEHLQLERLASQVRAQRRQTAGQSLRAFAKLYLHRCLGKPDSKLHHDLYALLQELPQRPGARVAIAAPRNSAKSTLVSQIFLLWCICHRFCRYIMLISDTAEKAADFLSHVKDDLTGNDRLAEDYPEVCEPGSRRARLTRWRSGEIVTRNRVKVTALGVGQNIRGRKSREDRPDLIILDDVESQENTTTQQGRAKLSEWFHKAVLKAGTPQTRVIMIGTIQHYDSLLARLTDQVKSPLWEGRIYRAVMQWSDRPELWQTWVQILRSQQEHEGKTGPQAARSYFEAHQSEMLAGTEVLWPEVEDYYTLMQMRESEGPASFDSEKQNEPVNPEDCFFLEEDLRFWDDRFEDEQSLLAAVGKNAVLVGACDPSLGRQGKHADDSAIITLLRDKDNGTLYVLDADIARRKPDRIIEDVLSYTRLRKYSRFGFESNQFQEFLASELQRRSAVANLHLPVEPIQHTSDKAGRIQSLQPLVRSGMLQFNRRHTTLLNQLRLFPKAAHDDGPDALEMAVATARLVAAVVPFEFISAGRRMFAAPHVDWRGFW